MLHLLHGMLTFQRQKASLPTDRSPNSQGCSDLHQLLNTAVSRALEIYSIKAFSAPDLEDQAEIRFI